MAEEEKILDCVFTEGEIGKHSEATARAASSAIGIIELDDSSSPWPEVGLARAGSAVNEALVEGDPVAGEDDGGD